MFLLVPAYPDSPGQKAVKRLCVCVCVCFICVISSAALAWVYLPYAGVAKLGFPFDASILLPNLSLCRFERWVRVLLKASVTRWYQARVPLGSHSVYTIVFVNTRELKK